jgi:hypothetical protein
MVMFICNLIHSEVELFSYFSIIGATVAATLFMFTFMFFLIEMFAGIARKAPPATQTDMTDAQP